MTLNITTNYEIYTPSICRRFCGVSSFSVIFFPVVSQNIWLWLYPLGIVEFSLSSSQLYWIFFWCKWSRPYSVHMHEWHIKMWLLYTKGLRVRYFWEIGACAIGKLNVFIDYSLRLFKDMKSSIHLSVQ